MRAGMFGRLLMAATVLAMTAGPAMGEVTVDKTTWRGHEALHVTNGTVELVIVTGLGPRIVRYAFVGGENALGEVAADAKPTTTKLGDWFLYGGHRLWIGPEIVPDTYAPDNGPVAAKVEGGTITLTQPVDAAGIEKIMTVTLAPTGTGVTVGHRVINRGKTAIDRSAWALTVMNGGGFVIIPNEPYKSHDEELQPQRAMTAWAYTDMSDSRWTWGRKYILLHVDPAKKPSQKIGVSNRRGWAGYWKNGLLFIKRYDYTDGATYPDFGVNTETYTSENFVELETLGPMKHLAPGQANTHEERWTLHKDVQVGSTEDALDAALTAVLK
jgi:hypothetical protein